MKNKTFLIAAIILAAVLIIAGAIFFLVGEKKEVKLEFDKYVFSDAELHPSYAMISASGSASSARPLPRCSISAVITDVKLVEAYNDPCLNSTSGCPTDYNPVQPAHYAIRAYVLYSEFYLETGKDNSAEDAICASLFKEGTTRIFEITDVQYVLPVSGETISGILGSLPRPVISNFILTPARIE